MMSRFNAPLLRSSDWIETKNRESTGSLVF